MRYVTCMLTAFCFKVLANWSGGAVSNCPRDFVRITLNPPTDVSNNYLTKAAPFKLTNWTHKSYSAFNSFRNSKPLLLLLANVLFYLQSIWFFALFICCAFGRSMIVFIVPFQMFNEIYVNCEWTFCLSFLHIQDCPINAKWL